VRLIKSFLIDRQVYFKWIFWSTLQFEIFGCLMTFLFVLHRTYKFGERCTRIARVSIDFERAPKYQHGLNCGHGLRRITSIVRSPAENIIWLDSLYRFWVAALCIRRVRACVRERVYALSHPCTRMGDAAYALHTHVRSFDLVTNRLEKLT